MKTKLNLKKLIKEKNFDYVNSDITDALFPEPEDISEAYKLFHFDRYISSKGAIEEMKKDGYRPTNIYELLLWKEWNEKDLVVALGSVGKVDGSRRVPCLSRGGSRRNLYLYWFDGGWDAGDRFLAVRNSVSGASEPALGSLETLTLENAIKCNKVREGKRLQDI